MKMTIKEALKLACSIDGKGYTKERYDKLVKFLKNLPQNPSDFKYGSELKFTIKDYFEGWYAIVAVSNNNGRINVEIIDGDMMDKSQERVKDNAEALKVMEELRSIKYAYDIDQHWNMTDDHRYWNRMHEHDIKMRNKADELRRKLQ